MDARAGSAALEAFLREPPEALRAESVLAAALELAGVDDGRVTLELPEGTASAASAETLEPPPALLEEASKTQLPATSSAGCCLPIVAGASARGTIYLRGAQPSASLALLAHTVALRIASEEARQRESLRELALAQAGVVPYLLDYATRNYTFLSPGIEQLTGYSAKELDHDLFGTLVLDTYPQDEQAGLDPFAAAHKTRAGGYRRWRSELRLRRRDGAIRWLSDASVERGAEGGPSPGSLGVLQDITARVRSDEERVRLAAIVETTTDVVALVDPGGRLLYLNRAGRELAGIRGVEDIGHLTLHDLHPPRVDRAAVDDGLAAAARKGVWADESTLRTADGRDLPVSQVVLAHRNPYGVVTYFSLVARDMSERKELEALLRQAQKMEAVGRLAGGIAHDFNNLLTAIGGYSLLALDRLPHDHPVRPEIEEIAKAGELAATLTRQLLVFSRLQVSQPELVDLNGVVSELVGLLRRLARDDVQLVTRLAPDAVVVRADRGQLSQVLLNLVVNAEAAMPDGGVVTIETALGSEGTAVLAVADTGVGMDEATRGRIFEPFFTTKQRGKGTGLGLATVFGVVEQSGGTIVVESEPGHGTTMRVFLPLVEDADRRVSTPTEVAAELTGREAVLLVDDDDAVRRFVHDVLATHGYTVHTASGGVEALELVEDEAFDVVITDLLMPGMSGPQLVERLAAHHPELKTLFVSGYTDDVTIGALVRGEGFLQKPFTPDVLLRSLREVIDSGGAELAHDAG